MILPQTVNVAGDNTAQQSVSSKPVEESYAVTDVVNVPARDKKKDKKVCIHEQCVCSYVCTVCVNLRNALIALIIMNIYERILFTYYSNFKCIVRLMIAYHAYF